MPGTPAPSLIDACIGGIEARVFRGFLELIVVGDVVRAFVGGNEAEAALSSFKDDLAGIFPSPSMIKRY